MVTTILGIDPAIRATGIARWRDGRLSTQTVIPTVSWPDERAFRFIGAHVWPLIETSARAFVVLEAPFVGRNGATALRLAGLSYHLRIGLWSRQIPFAVVSPAALKKFATGSGGSGKSEVITAANLTFNGVGTDLNPWKPLADDPQHEADALWAMTLGLYHRWRQTRAIGRMEPGISDLQHDVYKRASKDWPELEWS